MDIKERLIKNELSTKQIQANIQRLQQDNQQLLQELLRLDGENRLLQEQLQEEIKD